MSKNVNEVFVFYYKIVELTLAKKETKDEPDVDWEAMGVTGKTKKPSPNSFNGQEVEKAKLFWRLKTFQKSDIYSIEQFEENTMLHTDYGQFIIKNSFVEALQIIYKMN